jgi:hypothetical protein
MGNVLGKCRENQSTHFIFNTHFFDNRAVYAIISKNVVEPVGLQMTLQ